MRTDCVLLCDAATIRDGLLHILGGGVGQLVTPTFPAPLGLTLALRIAATREDLSDEPNYFELHVASPSGSQQVRMRAEFGVRDLAEIPEDGEVLLPIVLPLHAVPLSEPGDYTITLYLKSDEPTAALRLTVVRGESVQLAPPTTATAVPQP